jgi:two-component system chemotaxis response regulator CheB
VTSLLSSALGPEREGDIPYRVMVVDDSAVIRGLLARWIDSDPALTVVGTANNGAVALRLAQRLQPEILVLDVEMPEMDGLTALPRLLALLPGLRVVMASTLTLRNADISMKALAAGAADYIPKPTSTREMQAAEHFQRDLMEKLKIQGALVRRRGAGRHAGMAQVAKPPPPPKLVLRAAAKVPPRVVAIASSTGGPQALFRLFGQWKTGIHLPVVITQHMPPTFTTIFAEHLQRVSGAPCAEAVDGEALLPGHTYVAPGDWHMTVQDQDGRKLMHLHQGPQENYCRPSADPMLRSLALAYGPQVLLLVLTGMGHDGLRGAEAIAAAGGTVVAQDEPSSVVWGMPGAVATRGLCSAVLPLDHIAAAIERLAGGAEA